jgi:hypothetical protein
MIHKRLRNVVLFRWPLHGRPKRFLILDRWGVCFPYHGDEVIWVWPWKRKGSVKHGGFTIGNMKYISVLSSGYFPTLASIDQFWDEYAKQLYLAGQQEMGLW